MTSTDRLITKVMKALDMTLSQAANRNRKLADLKKKNEDVKTEENEVKLSQVLSWASGLLNVVNGLQVGVELLLEFASKKYDDVIEAASDLGQAADGAGDVAGGIGGGSSSANHAAHVATADVITTMSGDIAAVSMMVAEFGEGAVIERIEEANLSINVLNTIANKAGPGSNAFACVEHRLAGIDVDLRLQIVGSSRCRRWQSSPACSTPRTSRRGARRARCSRR